MLEQKSTTTLETVIRFFSYFTILTNILVASYFMAVSLKLKDQILFFKSQGFLTAMTVYITVVGLVYQVLLRSQWQPIGMQKLVDELLHSVIPCLVIIYWFFNQKFQFTTFKQIPFWLIYPLVYVLYVMIRGFYSDFYPYFFLNASQVGMTNVVIAIVGITALFAVLSMGFVSLGRKIKNL